MDNFTTVEACKYLESIGIPFSTGTMNAWRCLGKGPRYKKIGSKVFYEKRDLDEFSRGVRFDPQDLRVEAVG